MWYVTMVLGLIITAIAYRSKRVIARFPDSQFDIFTAYVGTSAGVVLCACGVMAVVLTNLVSTAPAGRAARLSKSDNEYLSRQECTRQLAVALANVMRAERDRADALLASDAVPTSSSPDLTSSGTGSDSTAAKATKPAKSSNKPAEILHPITDRKIMVIDTMDSPVDLAYHQAAMAGLRAGFASRRVEQITWQEVPLRDPAPAGSDATAPVANAALSLPLTNLRPHLTRARLDELHAANPDYQIVIVLGNLPSDYERSVTASDVEYHDVRLGVISSTAFTLGQEIYSHQVTVCVAPIPLTFRDGDYDRPLDASTFDQREIVITPDTIMAALGRYPRLFPVRAPQPAQ